MYAIIRDRREKLTRNKPRSSWQLSHERTVKPRVRCQKRKRHQSTRSNSHVNSTLAQEVRGNLSPVKTDYFVTEQICVLSSCLIKDAIFFFSIVYPRCEVFSEARAFFCNL